jgi:hypothetical protein
MRTASGASLLLLAAFLAAAQTPVIQGDYIEDRSNHVYGCYCEWSGESQTSGREAVLAWRIRSGGFAGTPLAEVKMAAVIVGEKTLSTGNAPRKSILVVDSSATRAQQQAAESLMRTAYARLLGEVLSVRTLRIDFERGPERALLRIGELVKVEMRRAYPRDDGMQGAVLWFDPFIPLTESMLGTTLAVEYTGDDFNHRWQRTHPEMTGYFGAFEFKR